MCSNGPSLGKGRDIGYCQVSNELKQFVHVHLGKEESSYGPNKAALFNFGAARAPTVCVLCAISLLMLFVNPGL